MDVGDDTDFCVGKRFLDWVIDLSSFVLILQGGGLDVLGDIF